MHMTTAFGLNSPAPKQPEISLKTFKPTVPAIGIASRAVRKPFRADVEMKNFDEPPDWVSTSEEDEVEEQQALDRRQLLERRIEVNSSAKISAYHMLCCEQSSIGRLLGLYCRLSSRTGAFCVK